MKSPLYRSLISFVPPAVAATIALTLGAGAAPGPLQSPMVVTEVAAGAVGGVGSVDLVGPDYCETARLILVTQEGERSVLTEGFQSACRADISFDGTRLLFSGKRAASDPWNIFEMELATRSVRQVTEGLGNCRSPIYLSELFTLNSPEPWNTLAFVSDRAGEIDPVAGRVSQSLYSCRLDGSEVRRLTQNPSFDLDPFLAWDGRVIYSSWQHSTLEHGPGGRFSLLSIYQDGTDVAPFFVHQGSRIKQMPAVTDRRVCIFVESDQPTGGGGGSLSTVELLRPADSYRRLTPDSDGLFHSPSPAADGKVLVSQKSNEGGAEYRVILLDPVTGLFTPLHARAGHHLLYPRAVRTRETPDGRSTVVDESRPNGEIYQLNIGINGLSDPSWLVAGMSRRLRVLEAMPVSVHSTRPSPFYRKRILGEVPIEEDGSFYIEVPANLALQLQILDADGMALQTCDWIWVKNREARGCIGCHEDPQMVPPNRMAEALHRPGNRLTHPPDRRRTVDFARDVAPVLEQSCSTPSCHAGTEKLDLRRRSGESPATFAERLYDILMAPSPRSSDPRLGLWVHPGRARTSPLVWHVLGKRTTRPWDGTVTSSIPVSGPRKLEGAVSRALIEWIDLGAHAPITESGEQEGEKP